MTGAVNPLQADAPAHRHVHQHVDEMRFGSRHLKAEGLAAVCCRVVDGEKGTQ